MKLEDCLKQLMIDDYGSVSQFADHIDVARTTVYNALNRGIGGSGHDLVEKIYNALGVNWSVIGWDEDKDYSEFKKKRDELRKLSKNNAPLIVESVKPSYSHHVVPMLGNVAAGEWREVYVQDGETVSIPDEFRDSHPRAFGVKPTGHSMDLLFRDDEIAICDPDMDVRDGSVALVGVNGDEATIKRVFFAGNTIVLHAESTMVEDYPDIAINTKDPASPPVHLIGEVFWKTLPAKPIKL